MELSGLASCIGFLTPAMVLRPLLWASLVAPLRSFVPTALLSDTTLEAAARSDGAINRLWTLPLDVNSGEGLGGGLNYAWDPNLCDQLLPVFSEDVPGVSFIDCDSLRAAFSRALYTWSVHHPMLHFNDVTEACTAAGDWSGGPVDGEGCSLAELWITAKADNNSESAATATTAYSWSESFRHTDGRSASEGVHMAVGSVIGFNNEPPMCWYLDSLFCSQFHTLKEKYGSDAVFLGGQVILWGAWCLALLSVRKRGCTICKRHIDVYQESKGDTNNDGKVGEAELARWLK